MAKQKKARITKIKTGKHKGEFKFTLYAGNGEAIAQSYPESYQREKMALKTLGKHFPDFKVVETPEPAKKVKAVKSSIVTGE